MDCCCHYTKSGAALDRLTEEIRNSAIKVALDYINLLDNQLTIHFKDELTTEDQAILDAIIENHSCTPLPDNEIKEVALYGVVTNPTDKALKVSNVKPEGSSTLLISHDYCDRTTWWSESVRVTNEELSADESFLTYTSDHQYWIDLEHGKVMYEDRYAPTYKPHIYVDNVEVTEGFSIDYRAGTITFTSSQENKVITADYSYENGSNWIITANSGKILKLLGTEVKFAKNCVLDSGQQIIYQIFANETPVISPIYYKSVKDFVISTMGTICVVPAFGNMQNDGIVLPFSYLTSKELKSSYNMSVKIGLKLNEEMSGEWGHIIAYCLVLDE